MALPERARAQASGTTVQLPSGTSTVRLNAPATPAQATAAARPRPYSRRARREVERSCGAKRQRGDRLDGAEGDAGGERDVAVDALRPKRKRDGGARNPDVRRGERQERGELYRRDDQECQRERVRQAERRRQGCPGADPRHGCEPLSSRAERRLREGTCRSHERRRARARSAAQAASGVRPRPPLRPRRARRRAAPAARRARRPQQRRPRRGSSARTSGRRRSRCRSRRPSTGVPRPGARVSRAPRAGPCPPSGVRAS